MRKYLISLFALASLIISTPTSFAHAEITSSTPTNNEVVTEMPGAVVIAFSEKLMYQGTSYTNRLSVYGPDGKIVLQQYAFSKGNKLVAVLLQHEYVKGTYSADYRAVSTDGHVVSGSISFQYSQTGKPLLIPSASPQPTKGGGDGVLPLPIVGAIALVTILGGYFALRARNRKR